MQITEHYFARMCELYKEWNAKINVVSRKDIDNLWEHHILHSLAIAMYLEECLPGEFARWQEGGVKVLDLGTGGGFPGIPLASVFPKTEFVLCDSIGKKIKVASGVAEELGLGNVRCVNARAESLPDTFDWVVSRAVADLSDLYSWVKGKYRSGLLCLKGGDINEEISRFQGRYKLPVSTWKISDKIESPWFDGKFVVKVEK